MAGANSRVVSLVSTAQASRIALTAKRDSRCRLSSASSQAPSRKGVAMLSSSTSRPQSIITGDVLNNTGAITAAQRGADNRRASAYSRTHDITCTTSIAIRPATHSSMPNSRNGWFQAASSIHPSGGWSYQYV